MSRPAPPGFPCRATGSCPPWGCISTRPCSSSTAASGASPVISHPVKKKYSREQLASLIYIVLSKNVLSLENIDTLFQMQRAHCTAAEAYDYFCDEVENCLPYIFGASRTICDLDPDAADEKRLLRGTIVAAVNKMYLDCCFVAMRQEEALWPGILGDLE